MRPLAVLSIQIHFSKTFSEELHAQSNNRWLLRWQFGSSPERYHLHKDLSVWVRGLSHCLVTQRTMLNLGRNWVTGFRFSKSFRAIHFSSYCRKKWPHWLHLPASLTQNAESKTQGTAQTHGFLYDIYLSSILLPPTSVLSNMTNISHVSTPIIFSLR